MDRRSNLIRKQSLSLRQAFCFFALLSQVACASYQAKVDKARDLLRHDKPSEAVTMLEPLATDESDDQLVYLLDYATALQQAGRYKESAKAFAEAEKIADIQDYHSLSRIAGSMLLSEGVKQYKGDDYEKVLINGLNAVNYLMMNDLDGALVEVRKLNNKLHKFKFEAKRDYEQNPYAFYLSAVIWEADKKWDDSYIDYKKAYDLVPNFPPLREDLIRAAMKAQRADDLEKWRKAFPEVKPRPEWKDPALGELVFIHQQGWGPRKQPRPENHSFPKLYPVRTSTRRSLVRVLSADANGGGTEIATANTNQIYSVQDIAIKTLDDAYGALVASRVAGIATKAVVADQIRQKNQLLGDLALIALLVSDQADLRQWSTLPETFQIARVYLKPGKYKVSALGLSGAGAHTGENMPEKEVEIKPGKKVFLSWRTFQ